MQNRSTIDRKFFRLENKGLELAEQLEKHIVEGSKPPRKLLSELSEELKLFTAAYVAIDPDTAYPICPSLHRSQIDSEHIYLHAPVDFDDGSYVQPKSGKEITDPEELRKLDELFAGGADIIFQHQSSLPALSLNEINSRNDPSP